MRNQLGITKIFLLIVVLSAFGVLGVFDCSNAVINGELDNDQHPYVGAVNNGFNMCSGALISPTVFVTAAHCFFDDGETVWVTFDPETDGPGPGEENLYSGKWYPHPEFCLDCEPGLPGSDTHDVGVVVLDEEAENISRYAVLPEAGLVDTLPMKTKVIVVGYGVQYFVAGGGPSIPVALYDRYVTTTELISSNHKQKDEYIKVTANPAKDKGRFCYGDSGGPNLYEETDIILAVSAYGADPLCKSVGYSNRIDTPDALEFINSFLP